MDQKQVRNFCIIAHIDHGKSTLADRLLERTGTISARDMEEQILDQMDLEREKGITIKAQAVRMLYTDRSGEEFELNLIDTPGHVDFTYEVSRSLAACEGAVLVVDATQGIEAQTLANVYLAMEHDLVLIPVVNKIDLPNAQPELVGNEINEVLGLPQSDIILASAKDGTGSEDILEAIVTRIPPPHGQINQPLRALIFDSKYDSYKGVIAYVRVVDGRVCRGDRLHMLATDKNAESLEIGVFRPSLTPIDELKAGEVGYIATGLKNVNECQVGDTVTHASESTVSPLPGYRPAKPMVFAGLYPLDSNEYLLLRDALDKLKLNDASLSYEPETSAALGFGFRCGFLGLLHMEIVRERLEREYGLDLLATPPNVEYVVLERGGTEVVVSNPTNLPPAGEIDEIREPWMTISVITPARYIGPIMELVSGRRGQFGRMEYLDSHRKPNGTEQQSLPAEGDARVMLQYDIPLAEILVDFYDQLKSRTQGYASLDYSLSQYRPGKLVKLDILLNGQAVDTLSTIAHQDKAYALGKAMVEKLRAAIPRQLFEVAIQAAVGSKVIARESIKPMRKNVTAKCYGGDITRKRKLLQKQAEGKKRMKRVGTVDVPQEAFLAVLKLD